MAFTVVEYVREDGSNPYRTWFDGLDPQAAAKVATATLRLEMGNMSRVKWIGTIGEFRIGIDKPTPDRVVELPPCSMRDPAATPDDFDTTVKISPAVAFVSAQIVYRDGSVSKVKLYRRPDF